MEGNRSDWRARARSALGRKGASGEAAVEAGNGSTTPDVSPGQPAQPHDPPADSNEHVPELQAPMPAEAPAPVDPQPPSAPSADDATPWAEPLNPESDPPAAPPEEEAPDVEQGSNDEEGSNAWLLAPAGAPDLPGSPTIEPLARADPKEDKEEPPEEVAEPTASALASTVSRAEFASLEGRMRAAESEAAAALSAADTVGKRVSNDADVTRSVVEDFGDRLRRVEEVSEAAREDAGAALMTVRDLEERLRGVEERVMQSIEVEIRSVQETIEAIVVRQSALEGDLASDRSLRDEAVARARRELESIVLDVKRELLSAMGNDRAKIEAELTRRGREATEAVNGAREALAADQGRARELLDAELERIRAQHGREQTALMDATRSVLARIDTVESRMKDVDRRSRVADELASALKGYQDQHRATPETDEEGRVDVNAASFEDLRALGLSVTQAARFVAVRDSQGGFAALDQIEGIPGIPESAVNDLLEKLRI